MMKKAMFAILCVALLFAVFSCGDDGPSVDTYSGNTKNGDKYTLKITDGTTYTIFINDKEVGTGKSSKSGDAIFLTQNAEGGDELTVIVDRKKILEIEGKIYPDDGSEPITPGEFVQAEPVAGNWEWATVDDSTTNEWKGPKQSVFAPGGASRITNATEDQKPFEYPEGTVTDNNGNTITKPVYNFTGNTKVLKDNRTANEGARFPQVGWEATPADDETLELLKTAYGYSFWVRLNSGTGDSWAFLTAVVTDFEKDEGHEYKHWFGNKAGDSGGNSKIKNYTGGLNIGTWYKIIVVMDKKDSNMFQDKWIWIYDSGKDYRGDFHQAEASRIQWQIPLQHQKTGTGETERSGEPYDVIKGSYDFNLDFYGLELIFD